MYYVVMEKPTISSEVILQVVRSALDARRERQQVAFLCIAEFRENERLDSIGGVSIEICLSILGRMLVPRWPITFWSGGVGSLLWKLIVI